jgi:hypothetical protein
MPQYGQVRFCSLITLLPGRISMSDDLQRRNIAVESQKSLDDETCRTSLAQTAA